MRSSTTFAKKAAKQRTPENESRKATGLISLSFFERRMELGAFGPVLVV